MMRKKHKSVDNAILVCDSKKKRQVKKVAFSYKPLWKTLIDYDMSKKELMKVTGISKSTLDKMGRGKYISMEVIDRLCSYFKCNVESIIYHYQDGEDSK